MCWDVNWEKKLKEEEEKRKAKARVDRLLKEAQRSASGATAEKARPPAQSPPEPAKT